MFCVCLFTCVLIFHRYVIGFRAFNNFHAWSHMYDRFTSGRFFQWTSISLLWQRISLLRERSSFGASSNTIDFNCIFTPQTLFRSILNSVSSLAEIRLASRFSQFMRRFLIALLSQKQNKTTNHSQEINHRNFERANLPENSSTHRFSFDAKKEHQCCLWMNWMSTASSQWFRHISTNCMTQMRSMEFSRWRQFPLRALRKLCWFHSSKLHEASLRKRKKNCVSPNQLHAQTSIP